KADLVAALDIDPKRPGTLVNLGNVLLQERDWEGAIAYYNDALRFEPGNEMAARNLEIARKGRGTGGGGPAGGGLIIGGGRK
ncbi:MAG: tetratricopeptide repeat protein, partial [Phreatobacter sp.]